MSYIAHVINDIREDELLNFMRNNAPLIKAISISGWFLSEEILRVIKPGGSCVDVQRFLGDHFNTSFFKNFSGVTTPWFIDMVGDKISEKNRSSFLSLAYYSSVPVFIRDINVLDFLCFEIQTPESIFSQNVDNAFQYEVRKDIDSDCDIILTTEPRNNLILEDLSWIGISSRTSDLSEIPIIKPGNTLSIQKEEYN